MQPNNSTPVHMLRGVEGKNLHRVSYHVRATVLIAGKKQTQS